MSDSALRQRNRGAYSNPFSGVGVEFFPLGVPPDHSGVVLHEAGYLPKNDWWDFPGVLSPFWRLVYNFAAGHRVAFANREIQLGPDHLLLIPDHQLFHCQGRQSVPTLWLHFSVVPKPVVGQAVPIMHLVTETDRVLVQSLAEAILAGEDERTRPRIFHRSLALLHSALAGPDIQWQDGPPAAIVETTQYIEKHYASPLYIPHLARRAGLCTESLSRLFKRYHGETIGRFIVKIRVREAAHLLVSTDATIEDIAEKTGFPNRAYLARVFKKITGESPAEFRHRHGPG